MSSNKKINRLRILAFSLMITIPLLATAGMATIVLAIVRFNEEIYFNAFFYFVIGILSFVVAMLRLFFLMSGTETILEFKDSEGRSSVYIQIKENNDDKFD